MNTENITEKNAKQNKGKTSRGGAFVKYVIARCQADKGMRAALKRADNPATEYQSWELLVEFGVKLDNDDERLPFASIASAIARANISVNGANKIGQAIAKCYEDGNNSDQAKAKLRRLLACRNVQDACRMLRPLFALIESRGVMLDYASLLNDLLWLGHDDSQTNIKAKWAQGFYGKPIQEEQL